MFNISSNLLKTIDSAIQLQFSVEECANKIDLFVCNKDCGGCGYSCSLSTKDD